MRCLRQSPGPAWKTPGIGEHVLRLALILALTGLPAAATACRLALVLAIDISSSVDAEEDALQRGGMAAALRDEAVAAAFFAVDLPVALAVFEWSGRYNQEVILDWRMIEVPGDLAQAATAIERSRRSYNEFPTAMGEALSFAGEMLARGPACLAQTVDMAGDGENNEGPGPEQPYGTPAFAQVTVNGLVVANAADFQTEDRLTAFYQREVLHGPGAFMVVADGFGDYARAIRAKLIREVSPLMLGAAQ